MKLAEEMRQVSEENFNVELYSVMKDECITFIRRSAQSGKRNYRYCRVANDSLFYKLANYLASEGFIAEVVYPYPNPKCPAIDIEW